VKVKK